MDYWKECVSEALEDAGIAASDEQIENITGWVEGAHENYGMARGYDVRQSPLPDARDSKIKNLEAEIKRLEQDIDIYRSSVARRRNVSERDVYLDRWTVDGDGKGHGRVMIEP